MKKILRSGLLATALLGASCGFAWLGNMNVAEAYMYGITDYNPTSYPVKLTDGVYLSYNFMSSAVYLDTHTAHIVSQEGNVYTLTANFLHYNQEHGSLSSEKKTYKYDVDNHIMYSINEDNGQEYEIGPHNDSTAQVTYRSAAAAMQLWNAVMDSDWDW